MMVIIDKLYRNWNGRNHGLLYTGRHDMPPPLSLPWALKLPPSRWQRSSSFPRPTRSHTHRCSRLTRQHGGEQSGLVTSTFDLLTLKVMPESRVTWATSAPILVFLGLSVLDLGLIYATDRQTDVRQHHRLITCLLWAGHKLCGSSHKCPPLWPWPFDFESGVRVTCDVGYLCANFVFLGLSVLDFNQSIKAHL